MRVSVFKLLAIPLSSNIIVYVRYALEIPDSEVHPKAIILRQTDFQVQNKMFLHEIIMIIVWAV